MPDNNTPMRGTGPLTQDQRQRIEALNTASACTGRTISGGLAGAGRKDTIPILPGDLVRVAQWIIDGSWAIIYDEEQYVERDRKSGWVKVEDHSGRAISIDGVQFGERHKVDEATPVINWEGPAGEDGPAGYEQDALYREARREGLAFQAESAAPWRLAGWITPEGKLWDLILMDAQSGDRIVIHALDEVHHFMIDEERGIVETEVPRLERPLTLKDPVKEEAARKKERVRVPTLRVDDDDDFD